MRMVLYSYKILKYTFIKKLAHPHPYTHLIIPTFNVHLREGHDAQDDDGRPAETVGEDNEEEAHRELAVPERERRVGSGASDAAEHSRVRDQDEDHAREGGGEAGLTTAGGGGRNTR